MLHITDGVVTAAMDEMRRTGSELMVPKDRMRRVLEAANAAEKAEIERNTAELQERLDDFYY